MRHNKTFDNTDLTCRGTWYEVMKVGVYFRSRSITRGGAVASEVVVPMFFFEAELEAAESDRGSLARFSECWSWEFLLAVFSLIVRPTGDTAAPVASRSGWASGRSVDAARADRSWSL